jgi:hypothetical protein
MNSTQSQIDKLNNQPYETATQKAQIMTDADKKGAKVFIQRYNDKWHELTDSPSWNWSRYRYAVLLPEDMKPTYRPYTKVNPEWKSKWIKRIGMSTKDEVITDEYQITGISIRTDNVYAIGWRTLPELFNDFTWSDGTPFGEVDNGN